MKSFLTQLASSDLIDDRKQLARILGFSTEPNVQQLVTLLNDKNLEVRLQAVESLGSIKAKAIATLHNLLANSTNAQIQKATVEALIKINSPDSIPTLRAAIGNPQITIPARFMALTALQSFELE